MAPFFPRKEAWTILNQGLISDNSLFSVGPEFDWEDVLSPFFVCTSDNPKPEEVKEKHIVRENRGGKIRQIEDTRQKDSASGRCRTR